LVRDRTKQQQTSQEKISGGQQWWAVDWGGISREESQTWCVWFLSRWIEWVASWTEKDGEGYFVESLDKEVRRECKVCCEIRRCLWCIIVKMLPLW
jgi:hypothetical protein